MIKYNLKCKNNHEFESWFSNSEEFEKLKKKVCLNVFFVHQKNKQINNGTYDFWIKKQRRRTK